MNVTDEAKQTATVTEPAPVAPPAAPGRLLHIRVNEMGKAEVNVKIPLALARIGMKIGARYAKEDLDKYGVDLDQLLKEADTVGQIADITDEKAHVEIFVE